MNSLALIAAATLTIDRKAETAARFEALMRSHERMVLATAWRLLGNLEDAKDASQEVFLRFYRRMGEREECTNPAGWLYRVTVNVCHDHRRRGRGETQVEEFIEPVDTAPDPQRALTDSERQAAVRMSLRILSEKERAAVVLRDLEGLSTAEVAAALGSAEATVRSQIAKARVKMKNFVESYFRRRI